ncbi:cupin domain-containing protein [archaeon]|nr:MAG: cupin domain-containing protein [archaeon]
MMLITRKDKTKPFNNPTGEHIYEMIGRSKNLGGATKHSFGHVIILPKGSSRPHYHTEAEETYYILKGNAKMVVDGREYFLSAGDAVFIQPPERHQIFNEGEEDLEFLVVCVPAWESNNSVYIDE